MSEAESPGREPVAAIPKQDVDPSTLPSTVLHPHKSYRRKYRKIMVKFERQMRESNNLFRDQQRLMDISQRLAETNDQILALLLELNERPQVPSRLRYDLRPPSLSTKTEKHEDKVAVVEKLRILRHGVQKGEVHLPDYQDAESAVMDHVDFAPGRSYKELSKSGSLRFGQEEIDTTHLIGGLLTAKQEETYLQALDAFLDGKAPTPRSHILHSDRPGNLEREMQLRNPVSVYNWLRRNQPQVFLQDQDSEKGKSAPTGSRKSKRESLKASKPEPELYDEEGIALDVGAKAGGKRKRDDDGGYRPKGGHPRPMKRLKGEKGDKEDKEKDREKEKVVEKDAGSAASGRRGKRASMDVSAG